MKKELFEIPVYSMSKEMYENRCFNYIEKQALETSPDNYEDFYSYLKETYYLKRPWKYNQIVGYVVISYWQGSIWFDEYSTFDKNIHAIGNKKHYIYNFMLNGYHFYIENKMTNENIKEKIMMMIESIEKEVLNKTYFIDMEKFKNILKYVDLKSMIKESE